ncbi:uncharacterized protein METZ01_LOCUS453617, partial [marine metagenome]
MHQIVKVHILHIRQEDTKEILHHRRRW